MLLRGARILISRSARPDEAIALPSGAQVIVRVDFGRDDFYEAFVEVGGVDLVLEVPETRGGALIDGKRSIVLSRGVPLTSYTKSKAWSFVAQESPDGLPMYGKRYIEEGKPGTRIEQVVLHATQTGTARAAFDALVARALSTHLFIERDGTIIQALDLDRCAYHAADRNGRSIGLDLVGEFDNLVRQVAPIDFVMAPSDDADARRPAAPIDPNAGVTDPNLRLPLSSPTLINGARVQSYGFSQRAMRSLEAMLLALWRAYPTLGQQMAAGFDQVADASKPGVMTHSQSEPEHWDPGPAFDIARIRRMAALVSALEAR